MYLIFTEDDGWHTNQLIKAFENNNTLVETAKINESSIIIDENPRIIFEGKEILLEKIEGAFVRGIPGGTLEEVCFHLDILHFLELHNICVYNNTLCIEKSVDKVRTSCILNAHKIVQSPELQEYRNLTYPFAQRLSLNYHCSKNLEKEHIYLYQKFR
mgnify:CR=1 FL=1